MTSLLRPLSHRTEREDTNTSILKNKKLGADAVQQKKHALTQEFKELYRERNVQVSEDRDDGPKPKEHKLRHALDSLLGENKRRDNRLNEMKLRLNIMKRDDISGVELSEKSVEQRFNKTVGSSSGKKTRGFEQGSDMQLKDGKDLVERFAYVKQTLQMIMDRREEEEETQKMLDAKITELIRNQKVFTDRIGKKEALYNMMEKRFLNLGKTEFAAKNKLTRTSNKLLTQKREMEKQKQHEEDYFNLKRTAFKRSQSAVEGFKDTIAKNLIYLEEIRLKKDEVDDKLEEVNYEEKQIISKRQASEYILLYIDLLENLERNYLKKKPVPKKEPRLNYDISPREKPKSLISAGTEETPKRQNTSGSGSHSNELERKGQNSSDTNKDRDIIITRIAQFYDQHPGGTNALVHTLLKIYHDMQLNEQSLSMRHQDLNTERLERQNEIEELEKALFSLQQGFILMEEKSEDAEEASPEHVRETERKVAGKLGQYDYKTVKLGEYLVNLCATGIQDTLFKLSKASCSLVTKSGKKVPADLATKAKEIEGFLSTPKPDLSMPDLTAVRNRSISKAASNYEDASAKDTSISIRPRTISLSTSSPKDGVINLHKADQGDDKHETSYRAEEAGRVTMSQQMVGEEFNKIEYLFKSCVPTASPDILYKWNEKVFESKWILDYLTKDDIKKVLNRYTYYYGNDISVGLLKSVMKDLKNEARLLQRKRTSEAFSMTEELLSLYLNHYKSRKSELCKRFDTEIKSEILDDLNHVLAVSEHVEKAHTTRYHNLFSEQQTEETDIWRRTEERRDSESEMELVSLRAKTPEIKNIRTTREAISDLHSHYVKERRGVTSSQSRRSYSVPKIRVVVAKTRKESFESLDNEDVGDGKGNLQLKKIISGNEERKGTEGSASKKKNLPGLRRNSAILTEGEGVDVVEEDKDSVKKIVVKKELALTARDEKKIVPIPSVFYKAQKKSKNVEDFKKKLIKDEEILRKIALLEKRQTQFDKKSKDYEKRRDYVPNFSLLQRFDLNKEKHRDQIIQEWWKRQEAGMLDNIEKEKTAATFMITSSRNFGQQTDSTRNILCSQKRRSFSRPTIRPSMLPEEVTMPTSRPGTGNGSRGKSSTKRRRDSFEDEENRLFNNAVLSQNQAILEAEVYKL